MQKLNFILEQFNGAAVLLTSALLIFLAFYLWEWRVYKKETSLRVLLVGLPPAIALAGLIYLDKLGVLMTRGAIWIWRMRGAGFVPFTDLQIGFLTAGAALTTASLLLLIRLLTRPRLGNWPWISSAVITGPYLLVTSINGPH